MMADGWDGLISKFAPQAPASRSGSGRVDREYVVNGMVKRGLPQHVAEGFAMNVADESGFDPGINEKSPTVAGSRGGFGLYQLTGKRRTDYEAFADDRGVAYNDPDAQMDWAAIEFKTTERRAAKSILSTGTAGEAAAAIVNEFLRPSESHRQRRAEKYLGASAPQTAAPKAAEQSFNRLWLDLGA